MTATHNTGLWLSEAIQWQNALAEKTKELPGVHLTQVSGEGLFRKQRKVFKSRSPWLKSLLLPSGCDLKLTYAPQRQRSPTVEWYMANPLVPLKRAIVFLTTMFWLYLALLIQPVVADDTPAVPLFRNADTQAAATAESPKSPLRLLADADFPPFSYANGQGGAVGISVDLALFACSEMRVTCTVTLKPFHQLLPALLRNEGDIIVSGMKLDEALMSNATMTRPYFWSFGRFAAPRGTKFTSSDVATFKGQKLGYIGGTAHGAWIEKYYADAELTPFATEKEMLAALKTGKVDAVFGDNLRLLYWLDGSASNGCCKALGEPYVDRDFFSRNLAFVLRRDSDATRKSLDAALDRLQGKGTSSELLARYLPPGFW